MIKNKYKVYGFLDLLDGEPGFVTPIFRRLGRFFIEVGDNNIIERFEVLPQEYHEMVRKVGGQTTSYKIGDNICFGFHIDNQTLFGTAPALAVDLKGNYIGLNNDVYAQVWEFVNRYYPIDNSFSIYIPTRSSVFAQLFQDLNIKDFSLYHRQTESLQWMFVTRILIFVVSLIHSLAWSIVFYQYFDNKWLAAGVSLLGGGGVFITTRAILSLFVIPRQRNVYGYALVTRTFLLAIVMWTSVISLKRVQMVSFLTKTHSSNARDIGLLVADTSERPIIDAWTANYPDGRSRFNYNWDNAIIYMSGHGGATNLSSNIPPNFALKHFTAVSYQPSLTVKDLLTVSDKKEAYSPRSLIFWIYASVVVVIFVILKLFAPLQVRYYYDMKHYQKHTAPEERGTLLKDISTTAVDADRTMTD